MTESGHLRRETDPSDRRKVILRYADHGMAVARGFFARLAEHNHAALADISDEELDTTHRTMVALAGAMRAYRAELPDTTVRNAVNRG
jgi:DNA-binding MarR family transcriptional regulator